MIDGEHGDRYKRFEAEAGRKLDDFRAEQAGIKSGYTYRTSARPDESHPDVRAKKANKARDYEARLTVLSQLMANPEYAEAHSRVLEAVATFRERLDERLKALQRNIDLADDKLESLKRGSPEYERLMREREDLQRQQQELLDYHNEVVKPFEDRLNDPDNPPSLKELEEFEKRLEADTVRLLSDDGPTPPTAPEEAARTTFDAALPTLG